MQHPISILDRVDIVNSLRTLQDAAYISLCQSHMDIPYYDLGCIHYTPAQQFPLPRDPCSGVPPPLPTAGEVQWEMLL